MVTAKKNVGGGGGLHKHTGHDPTRKYPPRVTHHSAVSRLVNDKYSNRHDEIVESLATSTKQNSASKVFLQQLGGQQQLLVPTIEQNRIMWDFSEHACFSIQEIRGKLLLNTKGSDL